MTTQLLRSSPTSLAYHGESFRARSRLTPGFFHAFAVDVAIAPVVHEALVILTSFVHLTAVLVEGQSSFSTRILWRGPVEIQDGDGYSFQKELRNNREARHSLAYGDRLIT
jgi:hypothetical protein